MKALAKRLEDRYQSAAAMRSDIERYLAGRPVQAPVPTPAPPAPPEPPTSDTSTSMRPPVPLRTTTTRTTTTAAAAVRATSVLILLGLLVLALIVGACPVAERPVRVRRPSRCRCPNVIGMTEDEARDAIGDAGLTVGCARLQARARPRTKDEVIDQDPNRDQYVDPGTSIHLTISSGLPHGRRAVPRGVHPGRGPQPAPHRQARSAVREPGVRRAAGPGPRDQPGRPASRSSRAPS